MEEQMNFGKALEVLKEGGIVTRLGWNNDKIKVKLQTPDANSKMTEPYLYMIKKDKMFPLDLSCESVLARDWIKA